MNKPINKGKWERFGIVKKEKLSTSGTDSNLETQWGLPITNDHIIICSQGRGWERLLKYHSSGAVWERSFLKRGPCQVSLESQREKKKWLQFGSHKVQCWEDYGGGFSPQPRVGHACVLLVYFKRGDGPACYVCWLACWVTGREP